MRLQLLSLAWASTSLANVVTRQATPDSCPGYKATYSELAPNALYAELALAGPACNVYGKDLERLILNVIYETDQRLHVKIVDFDQIVYQVPDGVFTRPARGNGTVATSDLRFDLVEDPFSFKVVRAKTNETLFDSSAASLIFEDQYIRLRTSLPESPSLYGLGESTDPFMLNRTNYTRTIWNRDAYGVPPGTNLYGDHKIYFDHRAENGTHAVFLLNSNGMDIKIDNTGGQHLEYNGIGGVFDFYFLAGPSPVEVAQQYSEVTGKSAMMPYWGLGFHQCRYGMRDVYEVAEVVANYSQANVPLETMWTDIDYMYLRWVFTLDPDRFPISLVQQLVRTLHERDQHYVVMVDPAVAYQDYPAFNEGAQSGSFLKVANGSIYKGVVWPGVTAFPDWFLSQTQDYWNDQFATFFDPDSGVDIDALWIDMNEPSNFCNYPCSDPEAYAIANSNPPRPPPVRLGAPRPIPGFGPDFQPKCHATITLNVNATTFFGENILVLGSAPTLGSNDVSNAVPMSAANYPIWSVTIDAPTNSTFTYRYLRAQPDGTYIFEALNRTVGTSGCDSSALNQDEITTVSPPHKMKARDAFEDLTARLSTSQANQHKRQAGSQHGLPNRDLISPPYTIQNAAGSLSNKTVDTDLIHGNGLVMYDTHNLYGAMMSEASRIAMLARRPTKRPMIITRSTFAGSGRQVGHWLGDNVADWDHYLFSIKGALDFAALFQIPMSGSDVCGFAGVSNDLLCARWATLGAFAPFYRNHGADNSPPHEFYRYPTATLAAQNAIRTRYVLLDYIYTALYIQSQTGTPLVQPMFFHYPNDAQVNALEYQYFYGPSILVAPVTTENSTIGSVYLPDGQLFYDFWTQEPIRGTGEYVTLNDVPYTSIPLYYKAGSIVLQRGESANTTTELRKKNFHAYIAPDENGNACGDLYLDDGESLVQQSTTLMHFRYTSDGHFSISGTFGYDPGVVLEKIVVLQSGPKGYYSKRSTNLEDLSIPLTKPSITTL